MHQFSCWIVVLFVGILVHATCVLSKRHYDSLTYHHHHHHQHQKQQNNTNNKSKYVLIDSSLMHLNKHHTGRHLCKTYKNITQPIKTKQPYCKPIYKKYTVKCNGYQLCTGIRLVYETHYKDIVTTRNVNEVTYTCCPGWSRVANRSHGCNKPTCNKPCLNGGKCVEPEVCWCPAGFSGTQCETAVTCYNECKNGGVCTHHNVCKCPKGFTGSFCEKDIDECVEMKPCDQKCYNTPGSYRCECKENFLLQNDGQTCRKENDSGTTLEAKDLEFDTLAERLMKLELMMDETHKNDVSKNDIASIYKNIDYISKDINTLKNKLTDVENYKNDMHVFKNKLYQVEKKTDKYEDLLTKIKKCVFYNKICT